MMTSDKHASGTDRCNEALTKYGDNFDAVINIQGDEPFIRPEQIAKVASCFSHRETRIATLVMKINNLHELSDPNTVKVVVGKKKEALYFSRTAIPYYRGAGMGEWLTLHTYYKHIGIYGYRADVLKEIAKLDPSLLEKAESLEQLRWLEQGFRISVEVTEMESFSIDTPEDLKNALKKSFK